MKIEIDCTNCGNATLIMPINTDELPEITACPCCGHDVTEEQTVIGDADNE